MGLLAEAFPEHSLISPTQTHINGSTVPLTLTTQSLTDYKSNSLCSSRHENEVLCQVRPALCPRLYMGSRQTLPARSPRTTGPCTTVAYGAPDALHPRTMGIMQVHPPSSLRG